MKQSSIVLSLLQGYVAAVQVAQDFDQMCQGTTAWIGKYQIKYEDMKADLADGRIGRAIGLHNDD